MAHINLCFQHLAQSIDLELFFPLSLIGFLIIPEIIASNYIQPGYLRYIKYLLETAIVIFVVIVAQKVLVILGWEIVFNEIPAGQSTLVVEPTNGAI